MIPKDFRKLSALLLVNGLALVVAVSVLASGDPDAPKPWPEKIRREIRNLADQTASNLSSALFNNIDEFKHTVIDFPKGRGKVGIEVHRDVFDNFDLLQTYTLIDRVKLKVDASPFPKLSTWIEDRATIGLGAPYVGVIFDPQASIEWVNVRPVKAHDFKQGNVPLPEAPGFTLNAKAPRPEPSPDLNLSEMNPDIPMSFLDPLNRARFSKIPSLFTFPFRLPLHRSDVSRMKDGEIIGYAFDGRIEVGVKAGLKVIPSLNVLHAGLEVRGTVITHGRYQISVLRENGRFARVKLTRLKESGKRGVLKIGAERYGVYDGAIIFKGTKLEQKGVGKFDLKVVPFQWDGTTFRTNQFDVVYRYDLESEIGKQAFHKAVLGQFTLSDEIADAEFATPGDRRVEQLVSRDSILTSKTNSIKSDWADVLNLDWNRKIDHLEATLTLRDGTHHVFQGLRETEKQRDFLFTFTREKRNRRMTLLFDEELYSKRDPESLFLITEITEEDSSTRGRELNRGINHMEGFLRKSDILPPVVTQMSGLSDEDSSISSKTRLRYGSSSFYYGYSLNLKEIEAFLSADRAVVYDNAKRYFNETSAESLIKAWDSAAKAVSIKSKGDLLFKPLRELFTNRFPIEPLTHIIFDTLVGQPINYFVTAQNVAFGRIQDHGKTVTTVDKILTLTDKELGFESYAQRLKQDGEALVTKIRIDPRDDGILRLRFTLSHLPENVFFRLFRTTGLKRQKREAEFIISNRDGRFKQGENSIDLDPYSSDLLTAKLSRSLIRDQFYTLSIAHSRSFSRFGTLASKRFIVGPPYPQAAKPPR